MADQTVLDQRDSEARVALDLMYHIANREMGNVSEEETAKRDYWLKLYVQCRYATGGRNLKTVQEV